MVAPDICYSLHEVNGFQLLIEKDWDEQEDSPIIRVQSPMAYADLKFSVSMVLGFNNTTERDSKFLELSNETDLANEALAEICTMLQDQAKEIAECM